MSSEMVARIDSLRKSRRAVILAHNYTRGEVQDVADFVGDSLGLSRKAAETDAGVVVFCGVYFMAETAAILCPDKTVLIPDENAGCPMANMLTVRELRQLKDENPDATVVTYVNSTVEVKAESDVCVTSSNAVDIVSRLDENARIIFVPDQNLGAYVAEKTGRDLILWHGYCPTHHRILAQDIDLLKNTNPGALAAVHPECTEDVRVMADFVGSTSQILEYCHEADAETFIIGTEVGMIHRLKKENPGKKFLPTSRMTDCPNMKLITLEKIVWSLEDDVCRVEVSDAVAARARLSIERMLEY